MDLIISILLVLITYGVRVHILHSASNNKVSVQVKVSRKLKEGVSTTVESKVVDISMVPVGNNWDMIVEPHPFELIPRQLGLIE